MIQKIKSHKKNKVPTTKEKKQALRKIAGGRHRPRLGTLMP